MAIGDTTALLRSIRRHTHIPDTHPSFGDADTLADATEELHSYLLPLGMAERQELWAGPSGRFRFPVVNGQSAYPVSPRAVGGKLRQVRLVDSQGVPAILNTYGREDVARWVDDTGLPSGLTVEGSVYRLFPTPRALTGYYLEVDVYLRPSELVPVEETASILGCTAISGGVTLLVLWTAENDALFSLSTITLDVVAGTPPFDASAIDVFVASREDLGGGLWNVTLATESTISVGDYLCLPGQSPVVQAPLEWHPLLALKVATRQLASLGDSESAQMKGSEGGQKERQASTLIRPRRDDVARKPRNGMDKWRGGNFWGY